MVRRTLFSHRICGWGIKSPTTPPAPNIHPSTSPAPASSFFYSQSPFKYLTLHQPLCVSAQRRLTQRYPIDTHSKPSVFWMCQNWLGFQSGCTCKCKRYLFSPLALANSYTHWGLVVGNLIPFEKQSLKCPGHRWQLWSKARVADELFIYYLTPVIDCCGKALRALHWLILSLHRQFIKNKRDFFDLKYDFYWINALKCTHLQCTQDTLRSPLILQ